MKIETEWKTTHRTTSTVGESRLRGEIHQNFSPNLLGVLHSASIFI
ncbi:hypothetical protein AALC75_05220 [Lachnospiraceae bacterium 48-42]|nr:hypothetical protein [Dorea sp.]